MLKKFTSFLTSAVQVQEDSLKEIPGEYLLPAQKQGTVVALFWTAGNWDIARRTFVLADNGIARSVSLPTTSKYFKLTPC